LQPMKINSLFRIICLVMITFISSHCFAQKTTGIPVSLPKQENNQIIKTPNDTLLPGNVENLSVPEYELLPSDNGGYVLGSNGWNDKCKCQQYKVSYLPPSYYYHIEGAIYWFGYKRADSSGLIRFAIWNMDSLKGTTYNYSDSSFSHNQPSPGTLFVAITDTVKNVDTSSNLSLAHIVLFPFPVLVTSDYCIGFDISNIGYDSIALVSTSQGQGGKLQLVWEQWSSNNKWYTLQGAQWDSDTLDIDAMILPIIDNTVGCVENGDYISGVKLSQSYPNPNPGECTISYELEKPQPSASIQILDMQGKLVYSYDDLETSSGVHNKVIDVSMLKNGTYFYILSAGNAHMAKKMIISR